MTPSPARRVLYTVSGILLVITLSLLLLLGRSLTWGIAHFGGIGMDEILFTLNMSMEGAGSGLMEDYLHTTLVPCLVASAAGAAMVAMVWGLHLVLRQPPKKWLQPAMWGVCLVWLGSLLCSANQAFGLFDFVGNRLHQSSLIEEQYVDPRSVELTFPEKKRNLIYIFLESGESSLQDRANGGLFDVNYTPNMTRIASENVSFSQSDAFEGAAVAPACGWTIAGMVAEHAGLPLKLFRYDDAKTDNIMGLYDSFLPGAVSLGDILAEQGYQNTLMIGSSVAFGGRDNFFAQHGNYRVMDYDDAIARGKIPPDYYVWWGYEDRKLYQYAREELSRLGQQDTPFNFTMLTVDTHHPEGYLCPLCTDEHPEQYGNVWSCADRQLAQFLDWCREQPFYDNTTIVIAGDHCSMTPTFYGSHTYEKHRGETERKVYNAILNAKAYPVWEKNRKFVTMDLFPTTLAALGVTIEGDRLGLGTNLFSDRKTLSEELGYEALFDGLNRKSVFYEQEILYPKAP